MPKAAGLEKLLQNGLSGLIILLFTSLCQQVEADCVLFLLCLFDFELIDFQLECQVPSQLLQVVIEEVHLDVYVILAR